MNWLAIIASVTCFADPAAPFAADAQIIRPQVVETRTIVLTQTVTLDDVPAGAKQVKLWVPVPSDAAWQRVLDRQIVSAPGTYKIVRQQEGRGDFLFVDLKKPAAGPVAVVVRSVVERQGVRFPISDSTSSGVIQNTSFADSLQVASPLMGVDEKVQELADRACGNERDPARQALLLVKAVADAADHYSKDPSKPTCGRGAADDCLKHGGGCCTDLHSLFIAMARARGIPARMQYGYRALDSKAGAAYDPGYRCWVEYFIPGAGWVPTDVVAADNADASNPHRWASLSATKVWLWEGRSFELTPRSKSGPVHTMLCGWAEIDGKSVDVLPAADGTPSKLVRTIEFDVLSREKIDGVKLPE